MNNFFNTNTVKTVNINGKTMTAKDIAKIVAFGPQPVRWNGSDTWVSPYGAVTLVSRFLNGELNEELEQQLGAKVSTGYPGHGENYNKEFAEVVNEALEWVSYWGGLKLYTCLRKNEGGESRFIDLDKLESMLEIELGDKVRERLSEVRACKDVDGDWVFESASGRAFRDNATKGILCEIAAAVNLIEDVTRLALVYVKRGLVTLEEIANESKAINIDRMTRGDIDEIVQAIKDSGVTPEEYTAYFSVKYNECQVVPTSDLEGRWDYTEGSEIKNFATNAEAVEFRRAFTDAYTVQKRRNKLTTQLEETTKYLQEIKAQLEAINA
jgi:hypothetical protein